MLMFLLRIFSASLSHRTHLWVKSLRRVVTNDDSLQIRWVWIKVWMFKSFREAVLSLLFIWRWNETASGSSEDRIKISEDETQVLGNNVIIRFLHNKPPKSNFNRCSGSVRIPSQLIISFHWNVEGIIHWKISSSKTFFFGVNKRLTDSSGVYNFMVHQAANVRILSWTVDFHRLKLSLRRKMREDKNNLLLNRPLVLFLFRSLSFSIFLSFFVSANDSLPNNW